MYFAEFLNHSSPDRLGILYPPTCVGLGYGRHIYSLLGFLGSMELVTSHKCARHRVSEYVTPTLIGILLHTYPGTTIAPVHLSFCVPLQLPATN